MHPLADARGSDRLVAPKLAAFTSVDPFRAATVRERMLLTLTSNCTRALLLD
jgi:hypothetical protein